jgi:Transposase DDE domain
MMMSDWQDRLISIYLFVCKHYQHDLKFYVERRSNYSDLSFSDEEVISLYLFGISDRHTQLISIYEYARRHLMDWFPALPSYTAFVQRLNHMADIFVPLIERIQHERQQELMHACWLVDSFPVALAKQGHRFNARVAPEIADGGYCATKKLYYYGVRVHIVARRDKGTIPCPEFIGLTGASDYDGKVFDQIRPALSHNELYGDKAYARPDQDEVESSQQLIVMTPVKKGKGQAYLDATDKWFSRAVSSVRQPIETLFGWINEKTGIQCASRVRSYNGLMVHVFGRLAAALFFWNYLRVSS